MASNSAAPAAVTPSPLWRFTVGLAAIAMLLGMPAVTASAAERYSMSETVLVHDQPQPRFDSSHRTLAATVTLPTTQPCGVQENSHEASYYCADLFLAYNCCTSASRARSRHGGRNKPIPRMDVYRLGGGTSNCLPQPSGTHRHRSADDRLGALSPHSTSRTKRFIDPGVVYRPSATEH